MGRGLWSSRFNSAFETRVSQATAPQTPPQTHSGTFPSVFAGGCLWSNRLEAPPPPPKSASPKNIRERSRVFLGTASKNISLKSASRKKIRERSRVFLGTASEDFSKVSLPEQNSGTFPSVCSGRLTSERFSSEVSLPKKIRERSRVFFGEADFRGNPRKQSPKTLGNVPECFWGLLPIDFPKVSLPEKNSGTFPSVFGDCFREFS